MLSHKGEPVKRSYAAARCASLHMYNCAVIDGSFTFGKVVARFPGPDACTLREASKAEPSVSISAACTAIDPDVSALRPAKSVGERMGAAMRAHRQALARRQCILFGL